MRKQIHLNAASKQRAYRERKAAKTRHDAELADAAMAVVKAVQLQSLKGNATMIRVYQKCPAATLRRVALRIEKLHKTPIQ